MTTNMITAARLIGHKAINGKYQSRMAMDKFPVLGHQMVRTSAYVLLAQTNSIRHTPLILLLPTLPTLHRLFILVTSQR